MPLVLDRRQVLDIYSEARDRKWVLPNFNAENLTTIEAVLEAVKDRGKISGIENLPIIIGITNNYPSRPQSVYYSHTRRWDMGLRLFLSDISLLSSPPSPFAKLRVMIHLDHIQWDKDKELLDWDMNLFSSIMFDASTLPFEENIKKTAAFVKKNRDKIVIEGACDEISESAKDKSVSLAVPDTVERYFRETGADIIVANLGTEHRASSSNLQYREDLAREIAERIGPRLCLHGTSSVQKEKLANLFEQGICKVNIWTALERDSSPVLFQNMIANAARIIGYDSAKKLLSEKLSGEKTDYKSEPSIDYFTTTYRQDIIFRKMVEIITGYLNIWYV
jgi:fructose-bisphosphate aldolase class II